MAKFSNHGEGTLTIARGDSAYKFGQTENITTQRGARRTAVDSKTHKVYLSTAQFGETSLPTKDLQRPRLAVIPNSFVILVFGK